MGTWKTISRNLKNIKKWFVLAIDHFAQKDNFSVCRSMNQGQIGSIYLHQFQQQDCIFGIAKMNFAPWEKARIILNITVPFENITYNDKKFIVNIKSLGTFSFLQYNFNCHGKRNTSMNDNTMWNKLQKSRTWKCRKLSKKKSSQAAHNRKKLIWTQLKMILHSENCHVSIQIFSREGQSTNNFIHKLLHIKCN